MNNTITTHDTTHPTIRFLIELGTAILKQKQRTDWLDSDALVKLADEHSIDYKGKLTEAELDKELRAIFKAGDELYVNGINVIGWERRVEWDLVFMVRFYPYNPAQYLKDQQQQPNYVLDSVCSD